MPLFLLLRKRQILLFNRLLALKLRLRLLRNHSLDRLSNLCLRHTLDQVRLAACV